MTNLVDLDQTAFNLALNHPKLDLTFKDEFYYNHTLLHVAVIEGNMERVKAIIEKSTMNLLTKNNILEFLLTKNTDGQTPLNLAKKKKWKACVKVLSEYKLRMEKIEKIDAVKDDVIVEEIAMKDLKEDETDSQDTIKTKKKVYKLCWFCSKDDVNLYKCGGCKKAYYCSDSCIEQDWSVHGSWCLRKQEKNKK